MGRSPEQLEDWVSGRVSPNGMNTAKIDEFLTRQTGDVQINLPKNSD